jgi:hypothetical protein
MRRIAVVGDKLDNDGEICHYNGMMFTLGGAGHQAALIDGEAYCPVCKTTGCIAKEGGPRRMTLGTNEIALDNDVVVCRCPEHPRVFARLAGEAWYDDMAETLGTVTPRATMSGSVAAAAFAASSSSTFAFDQQVILRSSSTGKPLSGVRYRASSASGRVFEGRTDATGRTERFKTDAAERIHFEIEH